MLDYPKKSMSLKKDEDGYNDRVLRKCVSQLWNP